MADVNSYQFDLTEVTIALIRAQGLTEGHWMLSINFRFGAGLVGGDGDDVKPGLFAQVPGLQLVRAPTDGPKIDWAVDASALNRLPENLTSAPASKPRIRRIKS